MSMFLDKTIKEVVDELNVRYFCLTFSVNTCGSKTPMEKNRATF